MALLTLQNEFLPVIDDALMGFLSTVDFNKSQELKRMIAYHMGWAEGVKKSSGHGKRIRPLLVVLCAGALDEDINRVLPGAVSLEFLHNFTLIHDDIEDNSSFRHGRPTLWTKWGIAQAINAGDALFSIAQMSMLSLRDTVNAEIAAMVAEKLNRVCLHLTCGQSLDISFESDDEIALDTYLLMIRDKTARLLALAASLSALVTEKSESIQDSLSDFGESLGLAFQIQDDILGIWGDPEVTGKSSSSDILAHKKSLPILFGLKHSGSFQSLWLKENQTPEDISQMANLLKSCGAMDYAKSQAETYTQRAFDCLESLFPEKNEFSLALTELTEKLLLRQS